MPGSDQGHQLPDHRRGSGLRDASSSGLQSSQACTFAANGMTNSTYADAAGHLHFLSGFLYADLILNNTFKTKWSRLPINLLVEYENNLNASSHPFDYTVKGVRADPGAVVRTDLGSQSHVYYVDISIGQQKNRGDIPGGLCLAAARAGCDHRILQRKRSAGAVEHPAASHLRVVADSSEHHRSLYLVARSHAGSVPPERGSGSGHEDLRPPRESECSVPGSGQSEPWLNRLQFDLIYTF